MLQAAVKMVEVAGFEPAAFWSRTKRATKLRYTSISVATQSYVMDDDKKSQ